MSALATFVLMALAAYRATRVVTADSITDDWRTQLFARFPPGGDRPHLLGQLVDCPWCIGFWLSGIVFALVWTVQGLPLPGLWWPALSTAVGLIGKVDD